MVLSRCEIWSLTLRKIHKLTAAENKILRRIFGPIRDEVTGGWRGQYNEELHTNKSRRAGHVARIEKMNA
jgi:hypothetical protein